MFKRKKKPLPKATSDREVGVITPAVKRDHIDVPIEADERASAPHVGRALGGEGQAEVVRYVANEAREVEGSTPAVKHNHVDVPIEANRRASAPDVGRSLGGEGRAEVMTSVVNEAIVADLAGVGSVAPRPTPRDDDSDDRTKGNTFLLVAKPVALIIDHVAEASGLDPLKLVSAGLKFIVEHAETAEDNKKDAKNLLSRIEKIMTSLGPQLDEPEESARRLALSKKLERISGKLGPLGRFSEDESFRRKCLQFLQAPGNAALIQECLTTVDQALSDYQLSLVQRIDQLSMAHKSLLQDLQTLSMEHINYVERSALDKLSRAKDAGFDASESDTRSDCLPGTRVDILRNLMEWAADPTKKQVYWLNGHAGSGKSTIAQSFAKQLASEGLLGASFFCSRDSMHASDRTTIFPTIAFQLASCGNKASPEFRKAVLEALKRRPDIASLALSNQLEELIIRPVEKSGMETVVIIDALDECRDDETTSIVLSFLAQQIANIPRIKFFITSRPEPHIRMGFRLQKLRPVTDVMILHEVGATSVDKDIRLFLEVKLNDADARARRSDLDLPAGWPCKADVDTLAAKSSGFFIFAATAIKFIFDKDSNPQHQLTMLLSKKHSYVKEGVSGLDVLYLDILAGAFSKKDPGFFQRLRSILGLLAVACDLISTSTMEGILGLSSDTIKATLRSLHSVLLVPEGSTLPIRFHHKSFPDFLTDSTRCTDSRFYINQDEHHFSAVTRCFEIMEGGLKKNICGLPRYAMNDQLDPATLDRSISEALRYSCRYWATHFLSDGNREAHLLSDADFKNGPSGKVCSLRRFLTTRQLHWFEVLGLLRNLGYAVDALVNVQEWLTSRDDKYKTLIEWADDSRRFILNAFDIIDASVAHIYHSALPFTSHESLLRSRHATDLACEAAVVIGGPNAQKCGPIRTVQMESWVRTLAYSLDGTMIAALNGHISCRLIRSGTGEEVAQLRVDNSPKGFDGLAFSHDNQTLATASWQCITLWDVRTGAQIITREEHRSGITSMAFHPDSKYGDLLAYSDKSGRICLWKVGFGGHSYQQEFTMGKTHVVLCWLRRHGQKIVYIGGSDPGCTELWEVDPPQQVKLFQNREGTGYVGLEVTAVASSSDGSFVAAGSSLGHIVIHDVDSGHFVHQIQTPGSYPTILQLQFSPTAKPYMLAFAAAGSTAMHIFYPKGITDCAVSLFKAHSEQVRSIAFSPDGRFVASGANDNTINIWETGVGDLSQDKDDDSSERIMFWRFSSDGQLLLSSSEDRTLRVWDTRKGTLLSILREHSESISEAVFLHDNRIVFFLDSSGHGYIWDRFHDKTFVQHQMRGYYSVQRIIPYTHGVLGFFHCCGFDAANHIDCWTIEHVDGTDPRMVLAARGHIHHAQSVVGIGHQEPLKANDDIALVLECKSDVRYSAIWRNARTVANTTKTLQFAQVAGTSTSLVDFNHTVISTEATLACKRSEDKKWVLDRRGRRILWIPHTHRDTGHWRGERLILEGGRLALIDFSRVGLNNSLESPF